MSMKLGASAPSTLGTCLRFSWFPRLFLVRVSYVRLVNTNSCEDVKDLFYWVVSSAATAVSSVNSHANKQAFASQTHEIAGVADDFMKKVDIRPKMCDPDSPRHYPEKMWLEAERGSPEREPWQSNQGLSGMGTETWNTHHPSLGLNENHKNAGEKILDLSTDDVTYRSFRQGNACLEAILMGKYAVIHAVGSEGRPSSFQVHMTQPHCRCLRGGVDPNTYDAFFCVSLSLRSSARR